MISTAKRAPAAAAAEAAPAALPADPAASAGTTPPPATRPAATPDALSRTLARAVARRASAGPAPPDAAPVLVRVRKKQTTGQGRGTTSKKTARSRGVKKPHRAAPQGPPQALAAVLPPRRSTRVRIPKGELDRQIHWGNPVFGAWTARNGGSSVRADLGPAAGQPVNYGSVPILGECTAVEWLNANGFAGHAWIKGHLLNDNLGGQGISENLTPMTHTANMRYKAFETSIKRAIDACYHHGQFHDQTRWYGVRVAIDVVGLQWPGDARPAVAAVADQVTTAATYIEKVGAAAPVAIAQPAWAPALVTGDYDCVA